MITTTTFYTSSNGDRWLMVDDDERNVRLVRHEANRASGGHVTDAPLPEFLTRESATPQGVALLDLLVSKGAIDPDVDA
jgi:hypothetical protein